mgnify:CR=1 FL=1
MRRYEMDVPAGMSRKPLSDAFGFVSRVVVHHEMKVEFGRRGALQVAKEFKQFVLRMTLVALAIDLTGFHVREAQLIVADAVKRSP